MNSLSRRQILGTAAAGALVASLHAKTDYTRHLGVQLYTLRGVLPKDPEGTLKAVADIGYREVEVISDSMEKLAPILKRENLRQRK